MEFTIFGVRGTVVTSHAGEGYNGEIGRVLGLSMTGLLVLETQRNLKIAIHTNVPVSERITKTV